MSEMQSSNSQHPELDEEALTALMQLDWRVSSSSDGSEGNIEIALHAPGEIVGILGKTIMSRIIDHATPEDIRVMMRTRDTKVPPLGYTASEWVAFMAGCRAKEFDS